MTNRSNLTQSNTQSKRLPTPSTGNYPNGRKYAKPSRPKYMANRAAPGSPVPSCPAPNGKSCDSGAAPAPAFRSGTKPTQPKAGPKKLPTHKPRRPVYWRTHANQPKKDERPSAWRRGYDERWRRCRTFHLARNPFCVDCLKVGRYISAVEVDHKIPIRAGGARFDDRNLQGFCRRHHAKKTQKDRLIYPIYQKADKMA